MFSKTNLISTLVTAIWAFAGGYLLWGIIGEPLLTDNMMSGLMKEMPDFLHLALGCLIMAFAFSVIYSKWARDAHSISNGIQFGIWLGILKGLGSGLIDYATSNMADLTATLGNAIIYIVFFAIMGALASFVYSKVK